MPTVASTYYSILTSVQAAIGGLGLVDWNGNAPVVSVRKLPKAEEDIDILSANCVLAVSPSVVPEKLERKIFGAFVKWYTGEVWMIAPGNRDFTTNLDTYLAWRAAVMSALEHPTLAGVAAVFDSRITPDLVLDRGKVNANYDYAGIRFAYLVAEPLT